MTTDTVVMWVSLLNIADWGYSKTQTLRETWKIQNQHQENLMYFRKQNVCSHKLDVLEANVSVSQFYRIRDNIAGCWIAHGRYSCS